MNRLPPAIVTAASLAIVAACAGASPSVRADDGDRTVQVLDVATATTQTVTASAAFRDEDGYTWSVDYSVTLGDTHVDIANAAPGNALISFPDAVATATVGNTTDRHNLPPRRVRIAVYVPRSIPHKTGDCENTLPRDVGCLLLTFHTDSAETPEIAVDGEATVTLQADFGDNTTVDDTISSYSEVSETFAVALGQPAAFDGVMLVAHQDADAFVDVSTCDEMTVWDTTGDGEQLCGPEQQATPAGGGSDSTVATASCEIGQTLRSGDTGPQVECLQVRLNEVNAGGEQFPVDGIFGEQTEEAVRAFQEANRLAVDGIVGPATGELLGIWPG